MSKKNFSLIKLQQRDKRKDAYLVLKRTVTMLNELNIPYVIDYGTLLGAYREKGYIQGDDDVDVSVPYTHTLTLESSQFPLKFPCGWATEWHPSRLPACRQLSPLVRS